MKQPFHTICCKNLLRKPAKKCPEKCLKKCPQKVSKKCPKSVPKSLQKVSQIDPISTTQQKLFLPPSRNYFCHPAETISAIQQKPKNKQNTSRNLDLIHPKVQPYHLNKVISSQ